MDPKAALEQPFEATVERRAGAVLLVLKGELDLAAKETYEQRLRELRDEGFAKFVVDLRGLTFIDSTGIKMLLQTLRDSEQGDFTATFVQADGAVQKLLETTGVARELPLIDESSLG